MVTFCLKNLTSLLCVMEIEDLTNLAEYVLSDVNGNVVSESCLPPEKVSHLPSWVLKMREKINTSRIAHEDAQLRITELSRNVNSLSAKLLVCRPAKVAIHSNTNNTKSVTSHNERIPHATPLRNTRTPIYAVPPELLALVFEYLQIKQVFGLETISRTFYRILCNSTYWAKIFPVCCPHLLTHFSARNASSRSASCVEMKACMQQYLKTVRTCTTFVQTMKDQRSVPKHRTVQPHRHTRQERNVTHPLPLFERSLSSGNSNEYLIPLHCSSGGGNGNGGSLKTHRTQAQGDMIMSHAETLSSDFRSVAHRALQELFSLTSDVQDPVIYKLVADGATTVFIALLMNEEAALRNYACGILANFLCWEARKLNEFRLLKGKNRQSVPQQQHGRYINSLVTTSPVLLRTLSVLFGMDTGSLHQVGSVLDQVQACGGHKMLSALLTSPTASINLAGSTQITPVNRGGGGGAGLAVQQQGTTLRCTTSSVQGMCNKQASRALVTLLYPDMPVPVPAPTLTVHVNSNFKTHNSAAQLSSVAGSDLLDLLSSPLSPADANSSHPSAVASAATAASGARSVPEQLRSPAVGALFTSDTFARPWQFTYFYKSGAVKDQFTAYLRFLPSRTQSNSNSSKGSSSCSSSSGEPSAVGSARNFKVGADYLCCSDPCLDPSPAAASQTPLLLPVSAAGGDGRGGDGVGAAVGGGCEVRGRGIDGIGTFQLAGHAEADISGWSWYFHKSYVPVTAVGSTVGALTTLAGGASTVGASNTNGGGAGGGNGCTGGPEGASDTSSTVATVTAQQWVQMVDVDLDLINSHNMGVGSSRGAPVHVSHVAYWSGGVENPAALRTAWSGDAWTVEATEATKRIILGAGSGNATPHGAGVGGIGAPPLPVPAGSVSPNSSNRDLDHIDESPLGVW